MNWRSSCPLSTSHKRAVLSQLPVARVLPSGEKATLATPSVWPLKVRIGSQVSAFHRRAVLSTLAEATVLPSGEKASSHTGAVCPVNSQIVAPVCASSSRGVPAALPASRRLPSAETSISMGASSVLRWNCAFPLLRSHFHSVPSLLAAYNSRPSGEKMAFTPLCVSLAW